MKINSALTAFACNQRRHTSVTLLVLVGVLAFYCAGSIVYALDGYMVYTWGTRTDDTGINIGSMSDRTCFLSGVTGNLSLGAQTGFACGSKGEYSVAEVTGKLPQGHYWLIAHGAACENQVNQKVWSNNPVNAQATCVFRTTGVINGAWSTPHWSSPHTGQPTKIAELLTGGPTKRQCFLSGVWGVAGSWNSSNRFARVRRVTTTDNTHPTPGWYIEANLPRASDGSNPLVRARCVDFALVTTITSGTTPVSQVTKTYTLTSGPGIKACALMGIQGAFKENSWNDGVIMHPPTNINGNWSLTVTKGKSATWACVK